MTPRRLTPTEQYPRGTPGLDERYIQLDNGPRLRVVQSGPPNGPPVLLLHGWGASLYTWRFLLPELAANGFRATALDFRGHGLSDTPRESGAYTREVLLADVRGAMDVLSVDRAPIVAWSMGGAVALALAVEAPARVAKLVLINPAGLTTIALARPASWVVPGLGDAVTAALVPRWLVSAVLHWARGDSTHLQARDVDEYWAPFRDGSYLRAMRALLREFDWRPFPPADLAKLRVSTLLIVGTADRLVRGVARRAECLPGVQLLTLPGAGHMAHEERVAEVNAAIVNFLESSRESVVGSR